MASNNEIKLIKAKKDDAQEIHAMQIEAFSELLQKYKDYDISPGAESIEKVISRINQSFTDYYIIKINNESVGAIRIANLDNGNICRISPIFVIPKFQNKGVAQKVIAEMEIMYKPKNGWILDTILEEHGNCHLYEKMGYIRTGKIENINEKMNIVFYEKKLS